jgi:raffinose/stachyose/melibiose transport system permease protein
MNNTQAANNNRKKRAFRENIVAILFLLPAILFLMAFMAYPLVYSGYLSFMKWDGVSAKVFIGFENFRNILGDAYFWRALINNGIIAGVALLCQVFMSCAIAYALVRMIGFVQRLYMFFYLVPVVISEICIGLLWGFIYNPYFGLLNNGLKAVGLGNLATGWLGTPETAFPAVINVMNFTYMGLYILLFVAAIQNIPDSVYDAALIDGAGHTRTFFSVVIPMIWESVQSTALLCVISSFKTFSLVFVLTNGGPNHASDVLSTYLYKTGFNSFQMGYASTIGFVQMLLTAFMGIIVISLLRKTSVGAYDV